MYRNSPFDKSNIDIWTDFINDKHNKMRNFCTDSEVYKDISLFNDVVNNVYQKIKEGKEKILIFGSIQSGKTDCILGIISKIFSNSHNNLVIILSQPNNTLNNQTFERAKKYFDNIYNYKLFKQEKDNLNKDMEHRNILLVLLKERKHLELLQSLVKNIDINKINVTIFDDEGDVTSFNNKNVEDGTRIYNLIKEIENIAKPNYISITASPYVHILVDKDNFLRPKHVFCLPESSGYIGLNELFNLEQEGLNIFKIIDDIDVKYINQLFLNPSLISAIKVYICQCYIWKYILNLSNKPRMLINVFRKKVQHIEVENQIKKILNDLNFNDVNDTIKTEFQISNFSEVQYNDIINNIKTIAYNGDSNNKGFDSPCDYEYQIIIGNQKVNRGITIIDLINTFIIFRSKVHPNADVDLQQARFLGYRSKYKEYIRVFLTNELYNDYLEINKCNQFLKQIISDNGNNFENVNYVPLSNNYFLNPTRDSVADFEYISENNKIPNDVINNVFYKNINDIDESNEKFYNNFLKYTNYNEHSIIFNNTKEFIEKFLGSNSYNECTFFLKKCLLENFNNNFLSSIIDDLFSKKYLNNYKIEISLLNENTRTISWNLDRERASIGKGVYDGGEKDYLGKNKHIIINIIPIKILHEKEMIRKIYRIRLCIPKDYKDKYNIKEGFYNSN